MTSKLWEPRAFFSDVACVALVLINMSGRR